MRNFRKIIPSLISIFIFSAIFIFIIFRNSQDEGKSLQLSPKRFLYDEKFGKPTSYNMEDKSILGLITNIRINKNTGVSEPRIVRSTVNPEILAVSVNDFSVKKNVARIFITNDGGMNWEAKEVPLSPKFKESSYSDPWIDYDLSGNLYIAVVQYDVRNNLKDAIFVAKSIDNGNTWNNDFDFIDYNAKENIQLDRPKIYVDKSDNIIYVTWIELKGLKSYIMFSKSSDEGNTFSPPKELEKNDVRYSSIISNSKGFLYLVYLKDEKNILVKSSSDQGNNWIEEKVSLEIDPAGIKSESQYLIKNSDRTGIRINSEPYLAVTKEDNLIIAYCARGNESDLSNIYFTKLIKNSSGFSKPIKVNADETNADQFLPSLSIDDSDNIFIIYQDSRNDVNNILVESYLSVSKDGGKTFVDSKLSTNGFNPKDIIIKNYLGDYNSVTIYKNMLIGVWTDGRNKNFDVYAGIINLKDFFENIK